MKVIVTICVLLIVFVGVMAAQGTDTPSYIPESCISVVTMANIQSDPGVSWMLDAWINSPRQSPLRELLKATTVKEMSVAVFSPKSESLLNLLCVMKLEKGAKVDKEKLNNIILPDPEATIQSLTYKGSSIAHVQGDVPEDFSAYTILQDMILIGSDVDVVKMGIDGPSINKSAVYQKAKNYFTQAKDGLLFADNSGAKFVEFLQPLEEKWKITLLLSSEYLDWMGSSFDMVDSNRASGIFVFQGADTSHIDEIKDDAEFLGEAFKRKFIAEKINYTSTVEVKGSSVVLNMQISGIEPLWKKLFEQGVLTLIRPGGD
ncbi:MAG: hypothetical protein AMS17_16645 [Spirochaetes bacterium DG_61]|nr:MAG: hypothetical protein AMS17_16645 [Spirochaetes bacterium DG_61]